MAVFNHHCWIFLSLGIAAYLGDVTNGQSSWDQTSVQTTQGDSITLTCTVTGMGPFDVVRLVHQFPDGSEHIVGENRLKSEYEESGRYGLERDEEGEDVILTLTNTAIRGEDRGRLGCFKRVAEGEPHISWVNIEVTVPVQEVLVKAVVGEVEERVDEGGVVQLKQRKRMGVVCEAVMDGTDAEPVLNVLVGGAPQDGLFTKVPPTVVDTSGYTINDKLTVTARLEYITLDPLTEFNEQELVCEAIVQPLAPMTATAILDVIHAPIVTCPKYEYYGQEGDSLEITCHVTANPSSNIVWYSGTSRETRTQITTDDEHFLTREKPLSQSKAEVTLVISNINASHFTQYYMSANNDGGEDDVLLKVEEAAEPVVKSTQPPQPNFDQNFQNTQNQEDQGPADNQKVVGGNSAPSSHSFTFTTPLACLLTSYYLFSLWKRD